MLVQLMDLRPGQRVLMKSGEIVEVTENLGDGIWVKGCVLTVSGDGYRAGEEDLVYCEDILRLDGQV